ncbi:MAG TPA: hypothetical protein VE175_00690, partial [Woeseiaceae bacterium]|nr:hypothetical protein [Woeseiaceae bacterium]
MPRRRDGTGRAVGDGRHAGAPFAEEIELLLRRLGSINIELLLYQIELFGLTAREARIIARETAGPAASWRQTGSGRFVMLFLAGGPGGGHVFPIQRLSRAIERAGIVAGRADVFAQVRELRCWSHDVVQPRYLL